MYFGLKTLRIPRWIFFSDYSWHRWVSPALSSLFRVMYLNFFLKIFHVFYLKIYFIFLTLFLILIY
jgi:hypothetical protein